MANIYAALIIKGKKSINDVPDKIRDEVKQVLIDEGHPELAEGTVALPVNHILRNPDAQRHGRKNIILSLK